MRNKKCDFNSKASKEKFHYNFEGNHLFHLIVRRVQKYIKNNSYFRIVLYWPHHCPFDWQLVVIYASFQSAARPFLLLWEHFHTHKRTPNKNGQAVGSGERRNKTEQKTWPSSFMSSVHSAYSFGAIHKRRHHFFEIFDPPPPLSSLLLNKLIK